MQNTKTDNEAGIPEKQRRSHTKALLGMLALSLVVATISVADSMHLRRQLTPHVAEITKEFEKDGHKTSVLITVGRQLGIVGDAHAKVEVFIARSHRAKRPDYGIEYHFARAKGDWHLQESGMCSGQECLLRGQESFDKD